MRYQDKQLSKRKAELAQDKAPDLLLEVKQCLKTMCDNMARVLYVLEAAPGMPDANDVVNRLNATAKAMEHEPPDKS